MGWWARHRPDLSSSGLPQSSTSLQGCSSLWIVLQFVCTCHSACSIQSDRVHAYSQPCMHTLSTATRRSHHWQRSCTNKLSSSCIHRSNPCTRRGCWSCSRQLLETILMLCKCGCIWKIVDEDTFVVRIPHPCLQAHSIEYLAPAHGSKYDGAMGPCMGLPSTHVNLHIVSLDSKLSW